jgi:NAD(P)-dependent dehydrogenase (short-subunit alcohol dehydrogenase family)
MLGAMSNEFEGRHVVVTGGTGALGSAVVRALLEAGAHCHIPVFSARELERAPFDGNDRVHTKQDVDLTDERSAASFFDECPPLWASIQIAGGFSMSTLADTSADAAMRLMKLNYLTCLLSCKGAVGRIRAAGDGGGRLVNVSARPALVPTGGMAAYAASKSAVASLTRALAEELAPERIWVNAIAPSVMDTPANRAAMADADHSRWPKVAEVAATVVHLASPANAVARGAIVPVYGRA